TDVIATNPVAPGANVSYQLTFGNTGTDTAHGTRLVSTLPTSTTFVSANNGGVFDAAARTITWVQNDLAPGAAGGPLLTVKVDPAAADGTTVSATATLTASNAAPVTTVSAATVRAVRALTLVANPQVNPVAPGGQAVFVLQWGNATATPIANA